MTSVINSPQLRKGVAEYCLLGLLTDRPKYGWELLEPLRQLEVIASIGTLYPLLNRLSEKGLISSFESSSVQGPPRKYYELTLKGVTELEEFKSGWTNFVIKINSALGIVEQARGVKVHARPQFKN